MAAVERPRRRHAGAVRVVMEHVPALVAVAPRFQAALVLRSMSGLQPRRSPTVHCYQKPDLPALLLASGATVSAVAMRIACQACIVTSAAHAHCHRSFTQFVSLDIESSRRLRALMCGVVLCTGCCRAGVPVYVKRGATHASNASSLGAALRPQTVGHRPHCRAEC